MSDRLTLSNRQRRQPLDVAGFATACEHLRQALFENLINRPPAHLGLRNIKALRDGGGFSVALVSDRQIKALNKQWRGKNSSTDVLSFPLELSPPPTPAMPWQVGEIFISAECAARQADEFGHSLDRELAFLFVHGMLHVLGFDHEQAADEKEMFSRQRQVLNRVGIKR